MAERRCEIEVTLAEISLQAAVRPRGATRHLLGASLIWPRTGTARKEYPVPVTLADGRWLPADRPWTERILFKENVAGCFGFAVTLTEALSDAAAVEFLDALGNQFVKETASVAGDLLAPPLLGTLAEMPLSVLAKFLLKKKAPATLGFGALDRDSEALPAAGETVRWTVPLLAQAGIFRTVRRRVGRTMRRQRETVVPAGGTTGHCVVELRVR